MNRNKQVEKPLNITPADYVVFDTAGTLESECARLGIPIPEWWNEAGRGRPMPGVRRADLPDGYEPPAHVVLRSQL